MAKRRLIGLGAGIGFLLLILDGKTALFGASRGIELCIKAVVPSLFPFFILSEVLICALWNCRSFPLRLAGRLFVIPEGAESLLLCFFMSGYPIGAVEVAKAYEKGQLSEKDTVRLLTFCSQPGPAFLFGMVGPCFTEKWIPWLIWGIIILSALFVSMLSKSEPCASKLPSRYIPATAAVMKGAIQSMASVCGWVIVFRVITAFLDRWVLWLLPNEWRTAAAGLLELSNGCYMLPSVQDMRLRFLLAAGMLSFGGLCVIMQTASVLRTLPITPYLYGKVVQTGIALLLSCALMYGHLWFFAALTVFAAGILMRKKAVAFSKDPMYNK